MRAGIFPWVPLTYLSVCGLAIALRRHRALCLPLLVTALSELYVNASAWDFHGSWSFGPRCYTDAVVVFALGLAVLFAWLYRSKRSLWRALLLLRTRSARSTSNWMPRMCFRVRAGMNLRSKRSRPAANWSRSRRHPRRGGGSNRRLGTLPLWGCTCCFDRVCPSASEPFCLLLVVCLLAVSRAVSRRWIWDRTLPPIWVLCHRVCPWRAIQMASARFPAMPKQS